MKISPTAKCLNFAGIATFIMGLIFCFILVDKFGGPERMSAIEWAIVLVIAFYHFVLGMLCFGVAEIIIILPPATVETKDKEPTTRDDEEIVVSEEEAQGAHRQLGEALFPMHNFERKNKTKD